MRRLHILDGYSLGMRSGTTLVAKHVDGEVVGILLNYIVHLHVRPKRRVLPQLLVVGEVLGREVKDDGHGATVTADLSTLPLPPSRNLHHKPPTNQSTIHTEKRELRALRAEGDVVHGVRVIHDLLLHRGTRYDLRSLLRRWSIRNESSTLLHGGDGSAITVSRFL